MASIHLTFTRTEQVRKDFWYEIRFHLQPSSTIQRTNRHGLHVEDRLGHRWISIWTHIFEMTSEGTTQSGCVSFHFKNHLFKFRRYGHSYCNRLYNFPTAKERIKDIALSARMITPSASKASAYLNPQPCCSFGDSWDGASVPRHPTLSRHVGIIMPTVKLCTEALLRALGSRRSHSPWVQWLSVSLRRMAPKTSRPAIHCSGRRNKVEFFSSINTYWKREERAH